MDAQELTPERRTRAAAALIGLDGPNDGPIAAATAAWAILGDLNDPDRRVELMDWLVRARIEPA